jgi:hypothetical protein
VRNHKLMIAFVFLGLAFISAVGEQVLFGATCTGADPCNACKNCKYCKHCAKDGGKCGVCKNQVFDSRNWTEDLIVS